MKKILVVAVLLAVAAHTHAQSKLKFNSMNYIGILDGDAGTYLGIQTINGVQRKTWFAGIGTGLDHYYFRSVPVYLTINKDFCDCNRTFFVSAETGLNWIWEKDTKNDLNSYQDGDFSPGLFWSANFGYKIGLKNKRDALLLSLGYSSKHLKEKYQQQVPCNFSPCQTYTERLNYHFNRLSIRAGWNFR